MTTTRGIINDTAKGGKLPAMATGTSKEGREKNFETTNPLRREKRDGYDIDKMGSFG